MFRFLLLVLLAVPAWADLANVYNGYAYATETLYTWEMPHVMGMDLYGDIVIFDNSIQGNGESLICSGPTSFSQSSLSCFSGPDWAEAVYFGGSDFAFIVWPSGDLVMVYMDPNRTALAPGQIFGISDCRDEQIPCPQVQGNEYLELAYVATPVPEPSSVLLFGFCLAACLWRLRRVVAASRR